MSLTYLSRQSERVSIPSPLPSASLHDAQPQKVLVGVSKEDHVLQYLLLPQNPRIKKTKTTREKKKEWPSYEAKRKDTGREMECWEGRGAFAGRRQTVWAHHTFLEVGWLELKPNQISGDCKCTWEPFNPLVIAAQTCTQ